MTPKRISIRPLDAFGRVVPGSVWRTVGVLSAAEDMGLVDAMPDDTERVLASARSFAVTVTFRDVNPDAWRTLADIPAGFPLWFVPSRRALPAPPVREALPWGDSCYTSAVYVRVDGWRRTSWCLGPVTDLTPSSEGPRGKSRAEAVQIRRLVETLGRMR